MSMAIHSYISGTLALDLADSDLSYTLLLLVYQHSLGRHEGSLKMFGKCAYLCVVLFLSTEKYTQMSGYHYPCLIIHL